MSTSLFGPHRCKRAAIAGGLAAATTAGLWLLLPGGARATDSATGISQIKLTYPSADTSSSIAVSWRDSASAGPGNLRLVAAGGNIDDCRTAGGDCQVVPATRRVIGSSDGVPYAYYQAVVTSLRPGTAYRYQVTDGAAPGKTYGFTTPVGGSAPFRAAFVGEVHVGDEVQPGWPVPALKPTLERIQGSGALFMLSAGDNVNTGMVETDWERLFATNSDAFGSVPLMTAVGNHETYGGFNRGVPAAQYFAAFPQPGNGDGSGRYYSYDVNGVHFAVVEANPETPRPYFDREMAWLKNDLAAAAKRTRFQIVVDHSPPFHSKTSRVTPTYENPEFREELVPLMDRYGVEMVISGHDKHYVRSYPLVGRRDKNAVPAISPRAVEAGRGTTYMELTSTGQNYADFSPQAWMAKSVPVTAAYLQLDFAGDRIRAQAIQPDGTVLDDFTVPQVK